MDELTVQRSITTAYIATSPTTVVLTPVTEVKNGNGKKLVEAEPRDPQLFKVNEPGGSNSRTTTAAGEGVQRVEEYTLVGAYDAAIEVNDRFSLYGREFEVAEVLSDNGYEKRARVVRRGW